jgi:DNA-binding transcriptional LysR family regulator
MDRLKVMETFVRVVNAGSFCAAAEQARESQAIVTKRLAQLEAELGARLLNRTTRRLSLTEIGRDYYAFCSQLIEAIHVKDASIKRLHEAPTGEVRVMAPKSFGGMHMARAVSDFMTQYGDVRVSLFLSDNAMRSLSLVENRFDLAIRLAPQPDSATASRKIGVVRWVACAAPSYLAKHGEPATPSDLLTHRCLVNTKSHHAWQFDLGLTTQTIPIAGDISTNSVIVLRQAALDGHGIALLPTYCIEHDLDAGRLQQLFRGYTTPEEPIFAVFPHRQLLPRKVAVFIEFMIEWLRPRAQAVKPAEPMAESAALATDRPLVPPARISRRDSAQTVRRQGLSGHR